MTQAKVFLHSVFKVLSQSKCFGSIGILQLAFRWV